jgi:hypothetical protein
MASRFEYSEDDGINNDINIVGKSSGRASMGTTTRARSQGGVNHLNQNSSSLLPGRGTSGGVGGAGIGGSGVSVTPGLVPSFGRYGRYSQLDARGMWTPACPVVLSGNRILPGQSTSVSASSWLQPRMDQNKSLGTQENGAGIAGQVRFSLHYFCILCVRECGCLCICECLVYDSVSSVCLCLCRSG